VIHPQTLHQINDRVLVLGQTYCLTQGYKFRVDSSVTETNIRYPLDNGLLLDSVRVPSRQLQHAEPSLPADLRESGVCSNHVRSARRQARKIGHGTPVVASDLGGLSFIVRDGETGFLVPEGDEQAFADCILNLLHHPELGDRLGARALVVAQDYAWHLIVDKIVDLYREVLSEDALRAEEGARS
jgi:hypothetical protein